MSIFTLMLMTLSFSILHNPNITGEAELALAHKLQDCISDIMWWMDSNKLKLNNDKTEFYIAGTKQSLQNLPSLQLEVGSCHINPPVKFVI
ncbi:hypothetical protein HOLleu_35739 [Holothuria leucospilota]|uniref:Uncharacterized protein n=1 Tax=Holothuria leucospilota TaxID=206669 RepID=A0A9Q1BD54_HOLLE|nr:hypothetical protein HOLleu_35739 [Holothuria leucospilota]